MKVPNTKWRIRRDSDWTSESDKIIFLVRSLVVSRKHEVVDFPSLEALYDDFKGKGIDEVYCLSVNDSFVMNGVEKNMTLKMSK